MDTHTHEKGITLVQKRLICFPTRPIFGMWTSSIFGPHPVTTWFYSTIHSRFGFWRPVHSSIHHSHPFHPFLVVGPNVPSGRPKPILSNSSPDPDWTAVAVTTTGGSRPLQHNNPLQNFFPIFMKRVQKENCFLNFFYLIKRERGRIICASHI